MRKPNRWVASQLTLQMDPERVRVRLWDEPAEVGQRPAAVLRIGDPGALWKLAANPGLQFGEPAFDARFNGGAYRALKRKYDPQGRAPTLFEKVAMPPCTG